MADSNVSHATHGACFLEALAHLFWIVYVGEWKLIVPSGLNSYNQASIQLKFYAIVDFFGSPILCAICTSTFSKLCKNLYSGMQKTAH
jgi:hypothetical protein